MSFKTQLVLAAFVACAAIPVPIARAAPIPFTRRAAFTLQNGKDAQSLNAKFAKLAVGDACKDGESGCVNGGFAQCISGKWAVTPCSSGLQCFALPLVNSAGTSAACDTKADAEARIAASGATGGIDGSGSSSPSNTSPATVGSNPSATVSATSAASTATGAPDDDTDTDDCDTDDEDAPSTAVSNASPTSALAATSSSDDDEPTTSATSVKTTKAATSRVEQPTDTSPPISVVEAIPAKRAFGDDTITTVTRTVVSTQYVTVIPGATASSSTRLAPATPSVVFSSPINSITQTVSTFAPVATTPVFSVINIIPSDEDDTEADTSSALSSVATPSATGTAATGFTESPVTVTVTSVRPSSTFLSASRSTSIAATATASSVRSSSLVTSSVPVSTASSSTTGRFHFSTAAKPTITPTVSPDDEISDADLAVLLTATISK